MQYYSYSQWQLDLQQAYMAKRSLKKQYRRRLEGCRRSTFSVNVDDDWYPNFPYDTIRLSVIQLPNYTKSGSLVVRICAWGADDYGLEIDYEVGSEEESDNKFDELIRYAEDLKSLEPINKEFLISEGFFPAQEI